VSDRKKPGWLSAAEASSIGIEMVVSLALGYFAGSYADRHLHTKPWLTILGFLIGIGASVKAMVRIARQYKRENPDEDDHGS
jgi:F0F1-type ATP synthase assembly protein I